MNHIWWNSNNSDRFSMCKNCGICKFMQYGFWHYYENKEFNSFLGFGIQEPTCNEIIMMSVLK